MMKMVTEYPWGMVLKQKAGLLATFLVLLLVLLPSKLTANTYSASFNGTNQYFSITDASQTGLDLTGDWTWTCWYNFSALPANGEYQGLTSKWAGPSDRQYAFAITNDTGTYKFYYADSELGAGDVKSGSTAFSSLSTGTWYHLAFVRNATAGTVSAYEAIEGGTHSLVGVITTLNTGTYDGGDVLLFGAPGPNFTNYFSGLQDDCRVWNSTLNSSELDDTMNEELTGSESGLSAYWKFENDALDTTANNNDLTNNNSVTFSTTIPDWAGGGGGTTTATTTTATTTFPLTYTEVVFMYQNILFLLALSVMGIIFSPLTKKVGRRNKALMQNVI